MSRPGFVGVPWSCLSLRIGPSDVTPVAESDGDTLDAARALRHFVMGGWVAVPDRRTHFRALFGVGACLVAPLLLARALGRYGHRRSMHAVERRWAGLLTRHLDIQLDISGLDHIVPGTPYIVTPLHEGLADVLAVLHLPLDLRFVARDELFEWPFFGGLLRDTGQVKICPEQGMLSYLQLRRQAPAVLAGGESLVVFPQGSILGIEVDFKAGPFALALALDRPILPIALTGQSPRLGAPVLAAPALRAANQPSGVAACLSSGLPRRRARDAPGCGPATAQGAGVGRGHGGAAPVCARPRWLLGWLQFRHRPVVHCPARRGRTPPSRSSGGIPPIVSLGNESRQARSADEDRDVGKPYDFVVIGAGSAGLLAAPLAAKLGVRVALVERDRPGGDCLYTGCVPSKTLLKVAKVAHEMRRADRFGLDAAPPSIDMGKVSAHIQDVIGRIYEHDSPEALRRMGVDVILGAARFTDPHTIVVNGRAIRGRRFLICTGSRPSVPAIDGLADVPFLTYEDLFSLKTLPRRLLVIGGGPVGMEMSQAFARLGSAVTVFQRAARLLTVADPDCSAVMADVFRAEGIDVRLGTTIERVERVGDEIAVISRARARRGRCPAGRRWPHAEPRRARSRPSGRGAQPGRHPGRCLSPHEPAPHLRLRRRARRRAVHPSRRDPGVSGHAKCPPARKRPGDRWRIRHGRSSPIRKLRGLASPRMRLERNTVEESALFTLPLGRVDRAQAEEDRRGFVKLIHRSNGTILGAHIVAARAGEMIQEVISVMDQGKKLRHLASTMHIYPTYSVGVQQAAAFALEKSVFGGLTGRLIRLVVRLS